MMWCLFCKTEYRKGAYHCHSCGRHRKWGYSNAEWLLGVLFWVAVVIGVLFLLVRLFGGKP